MYDPIELFAESFVKCWDEKWSFVCAKFLILINLLAVLMINVREFTVKNNSENIWFIVYSIFGLISLFSSQKIIRETIIHNFLIYFFCSGSAALLLLATIISIKIFMLLNIIFVAIMWLIIFFIIIYPLYNFSNNNISPV